MSIDNVTPTREVIASTSYSQERQTKLGLATVIINQEGDLFEASVSIAYGMTPNQTRFTAEGIFSSAREAFLWAYGVKQTRNDHYAGYQRQGDNLVELKPAKGKTAEVISVADALTESQSDYDNFTLARASKIDTDKVSVKTLTTSTLLSPEEQAFMAGVLAKLGKGKVS